MLKSAPDDTIPEEWLDIVDINHPDHPLFDPIPDVDDDDPEERFQKYRLVNALQRQMERNLRGHKLSRQGEAVKRNMQMCGTHKGSNKNRYRCRFPTCLRCGPGLRERLALDNAEIIKGWIKSYGADAVSAFSINGPICSTKNIISTVKSFSKSFRNAVTRHLFNSHHITEIDLAPSVYRDDTIITPTDSSQLVERLVKMFGPMLGVKKSGDVVLKLVPPQRRAEMGVMAHLHGSLAHPGKSRDEVKEILKNVFPADRAVHIVPFKDRFKTVHGADGKRTLRINGVEQWMKYVHDRSGCLKGRDRLDDRMALEQAVLFDAWAVLTNGSRLRKKITRLRNRLRIGKVNLPKKNASMA